MLFYYLYYFKYICIGALLVSLAVSVFTMYAYSVNSQRTPDDPEKRAYRPSALVFVFFTWPILLPVLLSLFLLRVLFYGTFVIIFITILLLIPREASEPTLLERKMARIGEALLDANTVLIKLMLRPWAEEPGAA
jgi:hypothetical protein